VDYNLIKHELQNILSGKSGTSYDASIQAVTNYLRASKKASTTPQDKFKIKEQEKESLIAYALKDDLLIEIRPESYISEGAEQKVYLKDSKTIVKLNDAIYYASWMDYFQNLLIHNYFFSDTAYTLIGFTEKDNDFYAVVAQNYILSDNPTDLRNVKIFLDANGFVNKKNNDYFHPDIGIILEDLHDENVLTKQDVLYFIDTVFYIIPEIFNE
jgi:hypothetical protein